MVAVEELSFTARAGEVVGLLGPNGAGKTTAIRVLTTIFAPTAGSFAVAGVPHTRPGGDPAAGRRAARERGLPRAADRGGVPALPRAAVRPFPCERRARRPPRCSTRSAWRSAGRRGSRPTAGGCGSGWASPGRWSTTRRSCSSTSPRWGSTRRASGRSCGSSRASRASAARPSSSARISWARWRTPARGC